MAAIINKCKDYGVYGVYGVLEYKPVYDIG